MLGWPREGKRNEKTIHGGDGMDERGRQERARKKRVKKKIKAKNGRTRAREWVVNI
jgi:IS5 family transposase